jgi:hypothetical protein
MVVFYMKGIKYTKEQTEKTTMCQLQNDWYRKHLRQWSEYMIKCAQKWDKKPGIS